MGIETDDDLAPPRRRRSSAGCLTFAFSVVAFLAASFSALSLESRTWTLHRRWEELRRRVDVPQLHVTVEERPTAGVPEHPYRVRILNLDARPLERLELTVEAVQGEAKLPPPRAFATVPAYPVTVRGDGRRAVVRFDRDVPPGAAVDLLVLDAAPDPKLPGREWLVVTVGTKQGDSDVAFNRMIPHNPRGR